MKLSARGFTLIELLVVIAIIAVLSVVGIAVFRGVTSAAQDARRKGDVDSIAKAYEINASGGKYVAISDSQFASGKKPKDPGKGDYYTYLANDGSGYNVCASLDKNTSPVCNTSAANCYCKFSSQSTISSTSTADVSSTYPGSGPPPVGSSSSCDTGGSLSVGLVGYWKMDEAFWNGTTGEVKNWTGINNGTSMPNSPFSGPTTVAGNFGNAGSFDGINDTVNIGNPTILNFGSANSFSYGAWVYFTGTTSTWQLPIWKGAGSANSPGYDIEFNTSLSAIEPDINDGTNWVRPSPCPPCTYSQTFSLNSWYHIFAVADLTNNTFTLYVNGQAKSPVMTIPSNWAGFTTNANNFSIGATQTPSYFFKGLIDDVRIYNRPLSSDEIKLLAGVPPPPCVAP